jgi:dynein light chain LC8-type
MTETASGEDAAPIAAHHSFQVLESHMPLAKEKSAVEIAIAAVEKNKHLMDIAAHVKTQYDKMYPGSGKATEGVYHAICGQHFASARHPSAPAPASPPRHDRSGSEHR